MKLQAYQQPVRKGATGGIDPYMVCVTFSSSPLCSLSIVFSGFGACLRDIMCLWLRAPVCARVHGGSVSHQHCRILAIIKPHKGLKPKVQCFYPSPRCLWFPLQCRTYTAECIASSPSLFPHSILPFSSRCLPQYLFWCS